MSDFPRKPVGSDPESLFHQATHEILHGGPRKTISSPGITVEQTTRGVRYKIRNKPSAKPVDWASPIVYDKDKSYRKGHVVVIRPTDSIVTDGAEDTDASEVIKALAGTWKATRAVKPDTSGETPTYNVPQWPLPTPDDPDAEDVYWWPISFYPTLTVDCSGDTPKDVYTNASEVPPEEEA